MKRLSKKVLSLSIVGLGLLAGSQTEATSVQRYQEMHRLYNPNSGEHFYTANTGEKDNLVAAGWSYENVGWYAPMSGDEVYRLYNRNAGDHHYTVNAGEKDSLIAAGWEYENVGWYSSSDREVPLYRAYNPNAKAGSHNYTVSLSEQNNLVSAGWKDELIAWYGVTVDSDPVPNPTPTPTPDPTPDPDPVPTPEPEPTPEVKPVINVKDVSLNIGASWDKGMNFVSATDEKGQPLSIDSLTVSGDVNTAKAGSNLIYYSYKNVTVSAKVTVIGETFNAREIALENFRLVNEERKKLGLDECTWNEKLYNCSLIRANELTIKYSHDRPNGGKLSEVLISNGVTGFRTMNENIDGEFFKNTNKETAKLFFEAWKNSPGHYATMTSKYYSEMATSYVLGQDGLIYGQQFFVGYP